MTTITAKTILRSRNAASPDKVLSTLLLRLPRWIHAEGRTHRLIEIFEGYGITPYTPALMDCDDLSRNAGSSRAIPIEKLIQDVLDDTAVPLYWGKNIAGMQAHEELPPHLIELAKAEWFGARDDAIKRARKLAVLDPELKIGAHKQIVNRLLEPFSHITVLVSATEWSNFLALRDHPDAEPHIAMLAREVRKCLDRTDDIQTLQPGEWHLPFAAEGAGKQPWAGSDAISDAIKLSVSRCASTSYKTVDGFEMTLERAIALHDKLVASTPLHASPCEHVAQADDGMSLGAGWHWACPEQHGNFSGFRQYRKMLPSECL
jgi:hypothetical protein